MTNNKQQTAVDWFHQKTWALKIQLEKGEISIGEYANTYATLYEQAKEMEKERLIDAFDEGQEYEYQYHINSTPKFDSETWYNETYGGGEQ
jgi:hypothetical protein